MKIIRTALVAAGLVMGCSICTAQGSLDDLVDSCEFAGSPVEQRLLDATAMLAPAAPGYVTQNRSGTYNVQKVPFTQLNDGTPVCPGSKFYGEPTTFWGRSGVLVGSDLVMTAPHTDTFNPQNFVVIFGVENQGGTCGALDWTNIPADNVYFAVEDTTTLNSYGIYGRWDYAVFRLDRPVIGRQPMRVRRSGQAAVGDSIILAGHPQRLTKKVDTAALYRGEFQVSPWQFYFGDPWFSNAHPYEGSSGSPVFNVKDEVLEAVVAGVMNGSWTLNQELGCVEMTHMDESDPNFVHRGRTNGAVADIAAGIPRFEALVSPHVTVVHRADLGQSLSQPSSAYTITAPSVATTITVGAPQGMASGTPEISSSVSPGTTNLGPNSSMGVTITASAGNVSQCGTWDLELPLHDSVSGFSTPLRHRFEIGLKEVSANNPGTWEVSDLGPPFTFTKVYEVSNSRPTQAQLSINTSDAWVLVNGLSQINMTLAPAGSPGDSGTFTLSMHPNFDLFPAGVAWQGNVNIGFTDGTCAIHQPIVRNVNFTHGVQDYLQLVELDFLALPTGGATYGTPQRTELELSDEAGLCVTDANLEVGFYHQPALGAPFSVPYTRIILEAPDGYRAVLWDTQTAPNQSYFTWRSIALLGSNESVQQLSLDDQSTPPLGVLLSTFNGKEAEGTWAVEVSRIAGSGEILPTHFALELRASACP